MAWFIIEIVSNQRSRLITDMSLTRVAVRAWMNNYIYVQQCGVITLPHPPLASKVV